MKKILLLLSVFALFALHPAGAEEIIGKGETLTLDRCKDIALKHHPSIVAAESTVAVMQSRIGQAQSAYYPQIGLSSTYSRSRYDVASDSSQKVSYTNDLYNAAALLTQTIYDFGKTPLQVSIQTKLRDSSQFDLANNKDTVLLNLKRAYYDVLKARRDRDVALETVKRFEKHLEQAKGFYEIGTRPKFDVTKAEVDLSNAKLALIRTENTFRVSLTTLSYAMGVFDPPPYSIEDNLSFVKYLITYEDAIDKALTRRPDLLSLITKKNAALDSINLAMTGYYPTLSGNAYYSFQGGGFPLDRTWTVGASLTFPLFSGFLTSYQVKEAKANLSVVEANIETLRQGIFLEVNQAYLYLAEAEEAVANTALTVRQAEENLDLANGRYLAGVGSPIELTDAEEAVARAKSNYNSALRDYRVAQAYIEKAIGE